MPEQHSLDLSQTIDPQFCLGTFFSSERGTITPFEFSMLCGASVHLALAFAVNEDGTSLSVEWVQEYPV